MAPARPWFLETVIYGIQVSAFADANGDGLGDLDGITEHLDYLASLGVGCLWLTPTYVSGERDNGYDVIDHRRIDERWGGDAGLDRLIDAAGRRGLRVVLELVPNHTSDQHPWFLAGRHGRDAPERSRYLWAREPADDGIRPAFPGPETSVWSYDELTDEWYRHLFYSFEPDLNVDDPTVRREFSSIVRDLAARGVAGFRVDCAAPMVNRPNRRRGDDGPLRHLKRHAEELDPPVALMAEADVPPEEYHWFFGKGDEMDLVLDFYLAEELFLALARHSADLIRRGLSRLHPPRPGTGYVNFLRNLDELSLARLADDERDDVVAAFDGEPTSFIYERGLRRRVASMLRGDRRWLELAWSLLFAMPGVPLLAYGDEIGLGDDLSKPERWSVRTAMQWTGGRAGGFSKAPPDRIVRPPRPDGPWGYRRLNVAAQERDRNSFLAWFRGLIRARCSTPELGWAAWRVVDPGRASVSALIYEAERGHIGVFHNLADEAVEVLVPEELRDGEIETVFPVAPDGRGRPPRRLGERFELPALGYRWVRTVAG
ncbi:MAG TPA: alpha-amylase family glycosyl hydrolase [Candidatus Limnocylindrales bacterium]